MTTNEVLCSTNHHHSVPVYDGRQKLKVGMYWETPYKGPVRKGSAVMVLFSIKSDALPKKIEDRADRPPGVNIQ